MQTFEDVVDYVERIRSDCGITKLSHERLPELSGDAFRGGEIAMLVECQLAKTANGYGAWGELKDSHILKAVRDYIRRSA